MRHLQISITASRWASISVSVTAVESVIFAVRPRDLLQKLSTWVPSGRPDGICRLDEMRVTPAVHVPSAIVLSSIHV